MGLRRDNRPHYQPVQRPANATAAATGHRSAVQRMMTATVSYWVLAQSYGRHNREYLSACRKMLLFSFHPIANHHNFSKEKTPTLRRMRRQAVSAASATEQPAFISSSFLNHIHHLIPIARKKSAI